MDLSTGFVPVNSFEVRGRTLSTEKNHSRDFSMFSTVSSVTYHERQTINNSMDVDDEPTIESPALSYETKQENAIRLNKATENLGNTRPPYGNNEASSSKPERAGQVDQGERQHQGTANMDNDDNVLNIQLPYNPNAPTELELWSGSFHPISLHRSIEQITSDMKSIKDLLKFMARYISNKKINSGKANDLQDFNSMGDLIWNFISVVYQANWDSLSTDNNSKSLREKISSKFTPRIVPTTSKNNKEQAKPVSVTINKTPPLPPLPAKSKKEVNTISKYFQSKKPLAESKNKDSNNSPARSYAQATKANANTSEVLKIKETFPALNAKKIDQVNSIVNGISKPKPRIQTTTKGSSRKQVIIPMSKENINTFMQNSSLHVANINRQLRNAKSEVLVDYICSETLGITIITSKVSKQSDLLIIDQYVKNLNNINALQVKEPRLPKSKSYLKITGILFYPHTNSQERLTSDNIEMILKQNQIFDNISLASKPRVIKISPKSNMSII